MHDANFNIQKGEEHSLSNLCGWNPVTMSGPIGPSDLSKVILQN